MVEYDEEALKREGLARRGTEDTILGNRRGLADNIGMPGDQWAWGSSRDSSVALQ